MKKYYHITGPEDWPIDKDEVTPKWERSVSDSGIEYWLLHGYYIGESCIRRVSQAMARLVTVQKEMGGYIAREHTNIGLFDPQNAPCWYSKNLAENGWDRDNYKAFQSLEEAQDAVIIALNDNPTDYIAIEG